VILLGLVLAQAAATYESFECEKVEPKGFVTNANKSRNQIATRQLIQSWQPKVQQVRSLWRSDQSLGLFFHSSKPPQQKRPSNFYDGLRVTMKTTLVCAALIFG
jgi:hypothetical protein